MKLSKRILCGLLTTALAVSTFTACSQPGTSSRSTGGNSSSADSQSGGNTDSDSDSGSDDQQGGSENNGGGTAEAPSNGTVLEWLGYYDLNVQDKEVVDKFNDKGYTVNYNATTSTEYFTKLAALIASSDSPDLVSYEWMCFPHGMSKNLYTALDDYMDFDSPTWSGIKDTIDTFNYGGKHYYIPYQLRSGVVLLYNATAVDNAGIDDPFELYQDGDWDWDAWKEVMTEWCNQGEDYYGILPTGFVAMPFIVSTGTPLIKVDGANKEIINNMKEANVQRTQDFLQDLAKRGMVAPEYMAPEQVFVDGKIMFAEFGLDWGYSSAQGAMEEDDIRFVPIPKDPNSDTYYSNTDTFGYLVPAGAKNVKASIEYMTICRENEIDPDRIATAKSEATAETLYFPKCPECKETNDDKTTPTCSHCGADRRVNNNHVAMSEELYDLAMELKNPESEEFEFLFDDCFGFTQELTNLLQVGDSEGQGCILGGPFKAGESYTTLRDQYFGTVESYIQPYRDALKAQ